MLIVASSSHAQQRRPQRLPESIQLEADLPYAGTNNPKQKLNLLLPKQRADGQPLPVIVYIHGGAWRAGDRRAGHRRLASYVTSGQYAGVSVGYRLTDEAIWPAQIHDCKAAIRWVRANAERLGVSPAGVIEGRAPEALVDLPNPDRVLIGGDDAAAIEALAGIYGHWVDDGKILRTNLWSSELSKLTANAFLAQRISSINSVAALCEATGADVREVARAIGTDSRIGAKFLNAGPGFGGSCFQKDILNLVYLCRHFGLPEVADYWESVVTLNTWQQHRIAQLVVQNLFGTVTGKRLAVLGFAFKADTNDTREAPAIRICRDLLEEGAQLAIHDPKVEPAQMARDLKQEAAEAADALSGTGSWALAGSVEEAVVGADAVLILTEWRQYRELNWQELAGRMRRPAWVFDSRAVTDPGQVRAAGLTLWRVGDGEG